MKWSESVLSNRIHSIFCIWECKNTKSWLWLENVLRCNDIVNCHSRENLFSLLSDIMWNLRRQYYRKFYKTFEFPIVIPGGLIYHLFNISFLNSIYIGLFVFD